ncbi:MAG: alpha-glucan family phosphorylase [Bacteroidetes bacterium]|nr:alpha-glucan family phosphorylase [Bacteroidota bacterium]
MIMTRPILSYTVAPSIPQELQCLQEIAYNLLWVWDNELMELFMRIDPDLWELTNHNPVQMLGMIRQERLNTLTRDDAFLLQVERARRRFTDYKDTGSSWFQKTHPDAKNKCIAYFSAEFGLTECLQNYSGGLGILSGDHLKAASDLGLPLVGMGLLYQQGYFRQYLNADGWQQERYPENDFYELPLKPVIDPEGKQKTIALDLPGRRVIAQIWQVQVGRVALYLLDTNIPVNSQEDQDITDQLYGGDREMRIKQEILLGIGGYRALKAMGLNPAVYHLNEGHSSFLTLEHCRNLMHEHHTTFTEAREQTIASTVFTTHTPVPAGNDYFEPGLIEKYFNHYYKELGLTAAEFLGLGRENPANTAESFCMTILALKMSGRSNGVSRLHGKVSREMWKNVWPGVPISDIPVVSITNGVHAPSWISRDLAELLDRYLGPGWREDADQQYWLWGRVHQIPDEELWRTHERRRERLIAFARNRLRTQLEARGATPSEVAQANEILNPEALTIGFSRRFATYKRATLLLRNPERLIKILTDKDRPVQFIFAGKAHPNDNPGKELIRKIIHFERRPEARRRMVFIEDYDIVVARYLVQGVDVWLNTPLRPQEASGTSGMKATLNGAINVSVLDGWWAEACNTNTGWAIGRGEEYSDEEYQNEVESNALFDLLEKEIIPLFYTRMTDDLPRQWILKMKTAMRAIGPEFNTTRMVRQYIEEMYMPALQRAEILAKDNLEHARQLAAWKQNLRTNWSTLKILEVKNERLDGFKVGDSCVIHAWLDLGKCRADDISVELFYGPLNANGNIESEKTSPMQYLKQAENGSHEFVGTIKLDKSGRIGHTVRVLPKHQDIDNPFREGLILWAQKK